MTSLSSLHPRQDPLLSLNLWIPLLQNRSARNNALLHSYPLWRSPSSASETSTSAESIRSGRGLLRLPFASRQSHSFQQMISWYVLNSGEDDDHPALPSTSPHGSSARIHCSRLSTSSRSRGVSPNAYFSRLIAVAVVYSDWMLLEQAKAGWWTPQENKLFEEALAIYDKDTPDRWERVAEMTGKTVRDVYSHYQDLEEDVRHIEEGLISFPGSDPPFTLDWENSPGYEGLKQAFCAAGGKRSAAAAAAAARLDHERKKGVPWTEEEHRLFLMGLKKYGKGGWRSSIHDIDCQPSDCQFFRWFF